jgi:arginyl-tRNA synthetase
MDIKNILNHKLEQAFQALSLNGLQKVSVRPSARPQFGDYQVNSIMGVAKQNSKTPVEMATELANYIENQANDDGVIAKLEVVAPGFINIFLNPDWLANRLSAALADRRLGVERVAPQTIVVDYSSPNVAKEMHVGHLRSTIIGDASVRTLTFLGHKVIRANHLGDWGTQFGMLIAFLEQAESRDDISLSDLEGFYRAAKKRYDDDEAFARRARQYVVRLQQGDEWCRKMWRKLVEISMAQNQRNYDRLNVTLKPQHIMGESLYNDMLPGIVDDLLKRGIASESDGAVVVYLDDFRNKEGEPMGVIVRKSDGGYLYTTTDIACAKYRYEHFHADRMIYYIDARQHQHLMMAWEIVRKAGYVPESVSLEHHMFGMMLDKQGRPFKTREGGTVKLSELLDEAVVRARKLVAEKSPQLPEAELDSLAEIIGIGAVKYADLSKNRTTDYIFDWDSMLSFEGNTAPYIQYACARIASIFRRADLTVERLEGKISLATDRERGLAVRLLQFEETLQTVAREGTPHVMCAYLYDLAGLFSRFYTDCPILNSDSPALRVSRLKLVALTERTLKQGLETLGIQTVERM